jgi:Sec-independent protein secretion pathway component TatC
MNTYSKRMAYTYAALGLQWSSPFIYLAIKSFLPESFTKFLNDNESVLFAVYVALAGAIFLFGKAWAYWGSAFKHSSITTQG